jgi:hypothetical protein
MFKIHAGAPVANGCVVSIKEAINATSFILCGIFAERQSAGTRYRERQSASG